MVTASAKRAYQRWLLQLPCWFGDKEKDHFFGYQCLNESCCNLEDHQTVDLFTHGRWTSLAVIMQIIETDKVRVRYPVCISGTSPAMESETVELFSGRLAPFGAFGDRYKYRCVNIEESENIISNPESVIPLDYTLRDKDSSRLKNLIYQLDRDWTVVFRDIGVMLPDLELRVESDGKLDISGTYLETGERFDGRAVYQFDWKFLVWDSIEKKWIITSKVGSWSFFAYNRKPCFSADLLDMSWFVQQGGRWVEKTNGSIKSVSQRYLKQQLFYPGTATVNNDDVFKLNNGVLMPRIGLGTGGLFQDHIVISWGLKIGYRLIDIGENSHPAYRNQHIIGNILKQKDAPPRNNLFLALKIHSHGYHSTFQAITQAISHIGTEYFDLLLIHQPSCLGRCNS